MSKFIQAQKYCVKVFDGTHNTPKPVLVGYPLITSKNILGGKLNLKNTYNISKDDYFAVQKRSSVSKWDVLFSMIGSIGETYLEKNDNIPYAIKNVGVFSTNDEYKAKWLYYYLISPYAKTFIKNYLSGAVQKFLALGVLREFPIIPYDYSKKKAVDFLYAIDSKIELNNKINSELEKIAKTIYDYWFVQFDFPDENVKPYKSSGGKMLWSNELKKEIPIDWEVIKLVDIFKFEKGVEPGSAEYLKSPINEYCIKFFRVGDIEGDSSVYIDSRSKKYSVVHEKDVIVTFDGSVGKLGIGLNGAISGGLRKVYDKYGKLDNSLVYFIFKDKRIIATIHKYATGSILLHASSSINHLKIAYKEKIYLQFQEIIQPIYNQIIKNRKENQKLVELRDFLLPMLMNGQVNIK